ncbi:MAG: AglZ/HisF2 family acetamidino modification protein [Agriterribacter sp.]
MRRIRVIPALLLYKNGLIKSRKFDKYTYVGDPINAVKIFNEKEVDELALIDIGASKENRSPDIQRIEEIASEAFMPMSYGGGIKTIDQIKQILYCGVEKVIINKAAVESLDLLTQAANLFGSQSVVASIDVKKTFLNKVRVYTDNGKTNIGLYPAEYAKRMENAGAGEILLNSIDRDGTYSGFDLELIKTVSQSVNIPVVAIGGASSIEDFYKAIQHGASAVAAGSMFVFQHPHNAVLISYPSQKDLNEQLYSLL